tara:strand:- start:21738 stop:22178 length:441 start_codon:yes stop_codon:yes gene_type:complete
MTWLPKKSVVVPIDFSDSSIEAVRVASEFVENPADLHLVHVLQPLHVAEPGMLWGTLTNSERTKTSKVALAARLEKESLPDGVTSTVLVGRPAQMISEYAVEVGADLIVIPSHGRSGLRRFFIGSVTEKVLRMAQCQVLVVRAKAS